jgi:hypothetical protein
VDERVVGIGVAQPLETPAQGVARLQASDEVLRNEAEVEQQLSGRLGK